MKKLFTKVSGTLAVLLSILLLAGCSNTPIPTELHWNHPANAQAEESAFIRPSNPFKVEVYDVESYLPSGTAEEQKKHPQGSMRHDDMHKPRPEGGSHHNLAGESEKHQH